VTSTAKMAAPAVVPSQNSCVINPTSAVRGWMVSEESL
jgi:hypothetical protein